MILQHVHTHYLTLSPLWPTEVDIPRRTLWISQTRILRLKMLLTQQYSLSGELGIKANLPSRNLLLFP